MLVQNSWVYCLLMLLQAALLHLLLRMVEKY